MFISLSQMFITESSLVWRSFTWLIKRFYGKSNSIVDLCFSYNLPPSKEDQTTENLVYLKAFIKYWESYMSTCLTFIIIISYEIRNSKEKQTKGRHIQITKTMELLLKASQKKLIDSNYYSFLKNTNPTSRSTSKGFWVVFLPTDKFTKIIIATWPPEQYF